MIEKKTEAGRLRRLDMISRLREKCAKFKELESLKNYPGWAALCDILRENIKTQETRVRLFLTQENFEGFNHAEARAAEKVRGMLESIIDCVENPGKPVADIQEQIKKLEEAVKDDEEQGA